MANKPNLASRLSSARRGVLSRQAKLAASYVSAVRGHDDAEVVKFAGEACAPVLVDLTPECRVEQGGRPGDHSYRSSEPAHG